MDCPSTSGVAFTAITPGCYHVNTADPWLSLFVRAHIETIVAAALVLMYKLAKGFCIHCGKV
jgi:hypothetical protein